MFRTPFKKTALHYQLSYYLSERFKKKRFAIIRCGSRRSRRSIPDDLCELSRLCLRLLRWPDY